MTDSEKKVAAAKASVSRAAELALPSTDPERGVEHDAAKHIARIEDALAKERQASRAMREAIITYGNKVTWLMRTGIAFGIVAVIVGAVVLNGLSQFAHRNREAIRVSCTLLTNAILESGAGGADQPARSPAAKAQRESTALYIGAIVRRLLTPAERKKLRENARIVSKAGGVTSIPNCDQVAARPERVKELHLGKTLTPARRSPAQTDP